MSESVRYMRCVECRKIYREPTIKRMIGICKCGSQSWKNARPTRLDKLLAKLMGR